MIRLLLILPVLWGSASLAIAEWHYARGMAANSVQASIDHLTGAGRWYPAEFKFRTAQAMQLFELSERVPEITPAAAESLGRAVSVDPGSAELLSKLLVVQRAIGWCPQAKFTADRLRRLAPKSEKAKVVADIPCG